ncbi:MAG: hypothetical protein IPF98_10825 [Gemmatimonadetes bacterium]|nr:hypothetical protein [Gemmatimonadota bacterium]MCC6770955.1 hypothetical protein [Gemmatimonadaceae bacterium]
MRNTNRNNNRNNTKGRGTPPPNGMEFVVVRTNNCRFQLTRADGARLVARLDRWWTPRWVTFVDLHGSLVRVRTSAIREIFDTGPVSRFSESVLTWAIAREDQRFDQTLGPQEEE